MLGLAVSPALVHEYYDSENFTNRQWYDYDIGFWLKLIEGELWGIIQQDSDNPFIEKFSCTPYRMTITSDPDLLQIFSQITQDLLSKD